MIILSTHQRVPSFPKSAAYTRLIFVGTLAASLTISSGLFAQTTVRSIGRTPLFRMPGKSFQGRIPELSDKLRLSVERLQSDVRKLTSEIGERNVYRYSGLIAAERFLHDELTKVGYNVVRDTYVVRGRECANLVAEKRGIEKPKEIVLIGAHYDSAIGTPGADDNASGTAAALDLARQFASIKTKRTVRFVFFVNEEGPWFQTDQMGSLVYAQRCRRRGDDILAMFSLESIGYYRDTPGSQSYPPPFSQHYPTVGNFVAFVSDTASGPLTLWTVGEFRSHAKIPSEGAVAPSRFSSIGRSDQWSFWRNGYRAVMVTDTANFRNPHYHQRSDAFDKIDFPRLAFVVDGLSKTFKSLANKDDLAVSQPQQPGEVAASARSVSTNGDGSSRNGTNGRRFRLRIFRR